MDKAEAIFHQLLEVEEVDERRELARQACGTDRVLMEKVERFLLLHDDAERRFPSEPAGRGGEIAATLLDDSALTERAGTPIGRYRLLEKLGEGGFGSVWAAEQREPVRRRVALKIIKLGMDTQQVVARFEAERQALALMDHPNIAKVLDAGATDSGRPYFVMELVKGIAITKYCDQEKLSAKARMELFIKVCRAVQHAHQKGVIHRDIKPSNVMVTLHDGEPVPKVIDFGIAKATQQELTEKTIYTHYGQFIGTPAYMSPEQAEMSGLDVDTRSDVYSLGVLLYELLTGQTPFDSTELMRSGYEGMRRIICQREPQRPSTKVVRLGDNHKTAAARQRSAEVRELINQLRGDLDWIVMKCLEKDRARRYDTANGLAMDIKRHLSDEPVTARPPSAAYRFQRFARRNKAPFAVAVAFVALLVGAALISSALAIRERGARGLADAARDREQRLNFKMAIDRGLMLCEQSHVGSGMLWLARALALSTPEDSTMAAVIRKNLTAWRRTLPALEGIYPHAQGVVTAAISPDGRLILTGCLDGALQLWDRHSLKLLANLPPHDAEAHEVVFNSDGSRFLTASLDKTARLWETDSRRLVRVFTHDYSVFGAAFTPDGKIITSSGKGWVRVWDPEREEPLHQLHHPTQMVHDIDVSPDSRQILGACHDNVALLWDLASHRVLARFPHNTRVPTAQFVGTNGTRIATGDSDGNVFLWEWSAGATPVEGYKVGDPWRHRGGVHRLRVSPDGSTILTASYDNDAQLLSAETGRPVAAAFEHHGAVHGVAFSRDGCMLTACDDNALRVWRPGPGSLLRSVAHGRDDNEEAIFTSDTRFVLTRGEQGTATVRNALTGDLLVAFKPGPGVYGFAVSPDQTLVVTGGVEGLVQLWQAPSGRPVGEGLNHGSLVWCVQFSPDGSRVLSGGVEGQVWLLDARNGTALRPVFTHPKKLGTLAVAFNPVNPSQVAVAGSDKAARLIDIDTGNVLRTFEGHRGSIRSVIFSRDGKQLLTGSFDNTLRVWDAASGQPISNPMRHPGPFWYFSGFSPSGTMIISGCEDGSARVWDIATSKRVGPLLVHEAALRSAAFLDNDLQVVTGTATGIMRIWDVQSAPMEGGVDRIELWLEVITGMELDRDSGEVRVLDAPSWQERSRRLKL